MKKKYIVLLSIILILAISYIYVFTGTTKLPVSKVVEKYDPFFNMLVMPLTKYEKGFFMHTFYAQTTIGNVKCDIRFKINYLNHTVTVENLEKLNERIKMSHSKIARFAVYQYNYKPLNEESYFDDIDNLIINLRLIEEVQGEDRQIIITVSQQKLKFTL